MKIFYFNDTGYAVRVYANTLGDYKRTLEQAEGDVFDLDVKEGQIPFIKVWSDGNVLLSSFDLKFLTDLVKE